MGDLHEAGPRRCASTSTSHRWPVARNGTSPKTASFHREQRRVDGRRQIHRVHLVSRARAAAWHPPAARFPNTMQLWALPLRDQDQDPLNRDIDNEAQGLAAEAAGGRAVGTAPGGARRRRQPVEVRIDWDGLTQRARRLNAPGEMFGGLTARPTGTRSRSPRRRRRRPAPRRRRRGRTGHLHHERRERRRPRACRSPRRSRLPPAAAGAAAGLADSAAAVASFSPVTAARSTSARAAASMRPRSAAVAGPLPRPAAGGARGGRGGGGAAPNGPDHGPARHGAPGHLHVTLESITRHCASRFSTKAGGS